MRDANEQALAFVYCEDEPGRRAAAKLLTRDEATTYRRQYRQTAGAAERGKKRSGRTATRYPLEPDAEVREETDPAKTLKLRCPRRIVAIETGSPQRKYHTVIAL